MNDEVKKLEAGEWWETEDGERLLIVGYRKNGELVFETTAGLDWGSCDTKNWHHLPDCTGWEWQPETFPQWYLPSAGAPCVFHRRDSKTKTVGVRRNGTEWLWDYEFSKSDADKLQKITQQEAEALIDKPKPIEADPEEWVEINKIQFGDMIPRSGVDVLLQDCDSNDCANDSSFITEGTFHIGHSTWKKWKFVCRRRDLPKIEPNTNRVAVRLYWYDGNIVGRYDHSQPTDQSFQEIKSDGNGGWFVEECV